MSRVAEFLKGLPRTRILLLGFLFVASLGALDYLTGNEISFSIFYLLPVAMVAWFVGRRAAIVISVTAAAAWLLAELLRGSAYSYPAIPLWNTLVRLGFFLIVTYILSTLQVVRENEENLTHFVVHDLRSPLSVILLGFEAMQEFGADLTEEDRQMIVRNGMTAGSRMLTLINSLLDLSRLESSRMPIRLEAVSVRELVERSQKEVEHWAHNGQLKLLAEYSTEIESVQADPELSLRILVNLLGNAIKFSPPESAITVRVAAVRDGMVTFSILDQGPGIPEELQKRVFDKFVRAEVHGKEVAVGSGVGLHFCQQAVRAQGGQIWLESEQGKGTTIHFTVPTAAHGVGDQDADGQPIRRKAPSGKLAGLLPERMVRPSRFGEES